MQSEEIQGVENYKKSLDAIEKYFTNLQSSTDESKLAEITYLKNSKRPKEDIIEILNSGTIPTINVDIADSQYQDGNTVADKIFSNIMEKLIEGLDVD